MLNSTGAERILSVTLTLLKDEATVFDGVYTVHYLPSPHTLSSSTLLTLSKVNSLFT